MTVTALDAYREYVRGLQGPLALPYPVGPDLCEGLSDDFGQDAFDALDWEVALEVDLMLTYGDRGPLPTRDTVALAGENAARADLAGLPDVYREPAARPLPHLPWMRNSLARAHA